MRVRVKFNCSSCFNGFPRIRIIFADLKHFYVNQPHPDREGMKRLPQYWYKPWPAAVLGQDGAALLPVSQAGIAIFSPLPGQETFQPF